MSHLISLCRERSRPGSNYWRCGSKSLSIKRKSFNSFWKEPPLRSLWILRKFLSRTGPSQTNPLMSFLRIATLWTPIKLVRNRKENIHFRGLKCHWFSPWVPKIKISRAHQILIQLVGPFNKWAQNYKMHFSLNVKKCHFSLQLEKVQLILIMILPRLFKDSSQFRNLKNLPLGVEPRWETVMKLSELAQLE